jgi:hypothetical protein
VTSVAESLSYPCIICGVELTRVLEDFEQQPNDGIMCSSGGNYGSTVFDDAIHGEYLEFNICDPCVVRAGEQGRLWVRRKFKPIRMVDADPIPVIIGRENLQRPAIPWHVELDRDDDTLDVTGEETAELPNTCDIFPTFEEVLNMKKDT